MTMLAMPSVQFAAVTQDLSRHDELIPRGRDRFRGSQQRERFFLGIIAGQQHLLSGIGSRREQQSGASDLR